MFDILVFGSATRDVFLQSDMFAVSEGRLSFESGAKLEIATLHDPSGGGGTNAAVTFARQGFKATCISVVGNDYNGEEIIRELKSEGVDVSSMIRHSDDYTAYSVILLEKG